MLLFYNDGTRGNTTDLTEFINEYHDYKFLENTYW